MPEPTLRRRAIGALAGACALAGAFLVGRCTSPVPPAEVRTEYVDRVQTIERVTVREVEVARRDASSASRRRTERTAIEQPDGTRITQEVETEDRQAAASEQTTRTAETAGELLEQRDARASQVVIARPDWRAGALVGLDVPELRPAFGAHVERRVLGPVFVGAWGLHTGQVGLSLSAEF